MFKGVPYSNKIIKRREEERLLYMHKQNLRSMRPLTTNLDLPIDLTNNLMVNNKKKDMLQEDRFTEIQRENRMLLEKINSIMSKKPTFKLQKIRRKQSILNEKERMNKSLNQGFRKKQLQGIEIENAKILKRLQQKKSDYDSTKLKQEWKKQKKVIQNIANYPFIIRDKIYKGRRKSMTSHSFHQGGQFVYSNTPSSSLSSPIQLVRIRTLNGNNFLITIKYDGQMLQIMGDNKSTKEIKIIEIGKQQALQFIHFQCDGKLELLFQCLRYDPIEKIMYLVGRGVQVGDQEERENQEEQTNKHQDGQAERGLKRREMSNIYQVDESKIQTQQNKVTETNFNQLQNEQSHLQTEKQKNNHKSQQQDQEQKHKLQVNTHEKQQEIEHGQKDKNNNQQKMQNIQNFQNLQNMQNLQNLQNLHNVQKLQNLQKQGESKNEQKMQEAQPVLQKIEQKAQLRQVDRPKQTLQELVL